MRGFWLGAIAGFGAACALNGAFERPPACATVQDTRRELIEVVPSACKLAATEALKVVFPVRDEKARMDAPQ